MISDETFLLINLLSMFVSFIEIYLMNKWFTKPFVQVGNSYFILDESCETSSIFETRKSLLVNRYDKAKINPSKLDTTLGLPFIQMEISLDIGKINTRKSSFKRFNKYPSVARRCVLKSLAAHVLRPAQRNPLWHAKQIVLPKDN